MVKRGKVTKPVQAGSARTLDRLELAAKRIRTILDSDLPISERVERAKVALLAVVRSIQKAERR